MGERANEQLTFFAGVDGKSGGVQVMYGNGNRALLFDFGVEHHGLLFPANKTSYEPVFATPGREVRQYMLSGVAAPLPELYETDQVQGLDMAAIGKVWGEKSFPRYDDISIYIGHVHQDHIALLPFVHPDIPVYMSDDSLSTYRGIVAAGQYPDTKARITGVEHEGVVDFGSFTMQVVDTDHNATGVAGIIIESQDFKIAYTGDWRRHGKHPEKMDRFIELCRSKEIDVLLTEGTRLGADPEAPVKRQQSEREMLAEMAAIVKGSEGLVYVQVSPRDLERMADTIQIAAEAGRTVVMDAAYAVFWHAAVSSGVRALQGHPALQTDILVLDATVRDGLVSPYATITIEQAAARKNEVLYFFKFPELALLIELELTGPVSGGSVFIHSDYSAKLSHPEFVKYLGKFGIAGRTLGNGGHAHPDALSDLIERIAPKVVVPMHTQHPKSLNTRGVPVYYAAKGETISIAELIGSGQK